MLCSSSLVNVCLVPVSLRVDDRALAGDGDGFLHRRDAHLRVDLRAEADRHLDALVDDRLEAGELELHRISADLRDAETDRFPFRSVMAVSGWSSVGAGQRDRDAGQDARPTGRSPCRRFRRSAAGQLRQRARGKQSPLAARTNDLESHPTSSRNRMTLMRAVPASHAARNRPLSGMDPVSIPLARCVKAEVANSVNERFCCNPTTWIVAGSRFAITDTEAGQRSRRSNDFQMSVDDRDPPQQIGRA